MKNLKGYARWCFPAIRVVLSFVLAVIAIAGLARPAQAAGLYTHSWFVEQAIEKLDADEYEEYSDLVTILKKYINIVNYGAIFPDLTYGNIDGDWAEAMHDTQQVNDNYAMFLEFMTDKGYDRSKPALQIDYFKEFLDDPNYGAVVPRFRASLIERISQIFNHSPRTENDEMEIAFLFGIIAHQEADASWHWNVTGWVGLEAYAFDKDYDTCGFGWPFEDLNHPETCLDVVLRNADNNGNGINTLYLSTAKPLVYSASDAVGIPRPQCKGRTLPWECDQPGDDPITDGQDQILWMWEIQKENNFYSEDWENFVKTYVPGGLDYGSGFVAAAWMQTWDLLQYSGIFYAKSSASGEGNCHSWEDACPLRYALGHSLPGQEIWVAAGVHTPTGVTTDLDATFNIFYMDVYGGFAGVETARDQRDPAVNLSILSGDLGYDDVDPDGDGILENPSGIQGNNSYHVVTGGAPGWSLDGFVITAGQALYGGTCNGYNCTCSEDECGGGMLNQDAGTLVTNITFSGNKAIIGGGMFVGSSASDKPTPTITSVTFIGNTAHVGGGMFIQDSLADISNVTFSGNSATSKGGGIFFDSAQNVISHATFYGNSAGGSGGGVYANPVSDITPLQIRNSIFWSNTASAGPHVATLGVAGPDFIYLGSSVVQGGCPTTFSRCDYVYDTDPMLGALGDHGGSTPTFPLLAGSSAIDAAADDYCLASIGMSGAGELDQRGVTRPQGLDCDIGAFEADNLGPTLLSFKRHDPLTNLTNVDQLIFTVTFSEIVHNLDASDFVIVGTTASITDIFAVNGSVYELTVSGGDLPGLEGVVSLDLAISQDIADIGENPLPDSEPPVDESYELSNAILSLTSFMRQVPATSPTNADVLIFRASFSAAALYVDAMSFSVTGTTALITLVTAIDSHTYDITISGGDLADLNGTVGLDLSPFGEISDLNGDTMPLVEPVIDETYVVDNIAPVGPSILRQDPLTSPTNATSVTFRVTFADDVQNIDMSDFNLAITGTVTGVINSVNPISASIFDVVITGVGEDGIIDLNIDPINDIADLAGNPLGANPTITTEQTFTIDNTYPIVLFGDYTIPADNSALPVGPTQIFIEFSEDMLSDGTKDAVNSPANYLLVEKGENYRFDTVDCAGGVLADDFSITINSVVYEDNDGAGPFMATLNINNGKPLPGGSYRLFVCGTTSVHDLAGNPLNGGIMDAMLRFVVIKYLPDTGFAPHRVTVLVDQPVEKTYTNLGNLWIEIPNVGVQTPIVGVPLSADGSWDVTWLDQEAGWLNGSAFPTHSGNSVLTGHVYDSNGKPGPFARLVQLRYGDEVIVHAWGASYVYTVRELLKVGPDSTSAMLKHQDLSWITLVTCRGYNASTDTYAYRILVRAVLTEIR